MDEMTGNWWNRLDSTAKRLIVLLTVAGIIGGWALSCATTIRVNAMALQKSIDAETRREERVAKLETDAALTRATTSASIDRIAAANEAQSQANTETARQVAALAKQIAGNAAQIATTQKQLIQVSDLNNRIALQERVIKKLSEEVNDLTKATTKLRKKVKEDGEVK